MPMSISETPTAAIEAYRENGRAANSDDEWAEEDEKAFAQRMLEYIKPVSLLDGKMMALWDPEDWLGELGYLPLVVIQDFSELLETEVVVGYTEGLKVPDEYVREFIG